MSNYKKARGWRNNNPLNIRKGERWIGLSSANYDTEFCRFISMPFGYRAAAKVLKSYYRTLTQAGKPFTVENIIKRWAPENENNTTAYIRRVEELLYGDTPFPSGEGQGEGSWREGPLGRPDTPQGARHIAQLMAAMTCVECGCPPSAVPYMAILDGVDMAYGIHPRLDDIKL